MVAIGAPTTLSILVTTCREMGARVDDVRGLSRLPELTLVRKEVARRCRARGYSLPAIARVLCRHHSSVIWILRGGRHAKYQRRAARGTARWLVSFGAGL